MIAPGQYQEFMFKLLADQRGKNALVVTEWEQQFLAGFGQSHQGLTWFSEGRVKSADRMWRRYGPELNWPHPLDTVTERPKLAPADPDGCEYLVRDDGVQRRCNEPAEFREPGRLRYCPMHAQAVEQAMKRSGKRIALVKFQPRTAREDARPTGQSSIENPKS